MFLFEDTDSNSSEMIDLYKFDVGTIFKVLKQIKNIKEVAISRQGPLDFNDFRETITVSLYVSDDDLEKVLSEVFEKLSAYNITIDIISKVKYYNDQIRQTKKKDNKYHIELAITKKFALEQKVKQYDKKLRLGQALGLDQPSEPEEYANNTDDLGNVEKKIILNLDKVDN